MVPRKQLCVECKKAEAHQRYLARKVDMIERKRQKALKEKWSFKNCLLCGNLFYGHKGMTLCSSECRKKHRTNKEHPPKSIACKFCGTSFRGKRKDHFCSDECAQNHKDKISAEESKRLIKSCAWCGKTFSVDRSQLSSLTCSGECNRQRAKKKDAESFQKIKHTARYVVANRLRRHLRRSRERKFPKQLNYFEWISKVKSKRNFVCYWCKEKKSTKHLHIDHIVPISKGGTNDVSNVCASCASCNMRKGSKTLKEWASKIGVLAI
jgi:5-methylcytosine-specific restriction endonuclease McrA